MAQTAKSRQEALDRQHANAKRNLENARKTAAKKSNYDSQKSRSDLKRIFQERFGSDPYDWQVDVSEALILGLDSVVIAGTGSGKTMPFMMPLLLDAKKKIIIISPLKVLQLDQVSGYDHYIPLVLRLMNPKGCTICQNADPYGGC